MSAKNQTVIRTVRFSKSDIEDIESFLKKNPVFDFSAVARIAIRKFIESPEIRIQGISKKRLKSDLGASNGQ